jgi:hypothetical protein
MAMLGDGGLPQVRFSRPLLQLPIRFDADVLAAEVSALPPSAWVPHPQGFPGNDAVQLVSVDGALNDDMAGPMAATEHLRRLPYTMRLMEELGGVWGRSRLMGLGPGAVVPAHVDIHYYWRTHIRIHVPVVTNPGVQFKCGGDVVHMAPGESWVFDSFEMHEVRNEGTQKRVHLVLDTVGSSRIWELIEAANQGIPAGSTWAPAPGAGSPALRFEQLNQPAVMSPWEIRCHVDYLLGHINRDVPGEVLETIDRFVFEWHAAWAEHGETEGGAASFRPLIRGTREALARLGAGDVLLTNEAPLAQALDALVFSRALKPPAAQGPAPQRMPPNPKAA